MGPRTTPPPLPDLEPNMLPEGDYVVTATQRECNWLQGLEGDIDTSHAAILHEGTVPLEAAIPGTFGYYNLADKCPRYKVVDTDYRHHVRRLQASGRRSALLATRALPHALLHHDPNRSARP